MCDMMGKECEYYQSILSQNSVCHHCNEGSLFTPKTPVKVMLSFDTICDVVEKKCEWGHSEFSKFFVCSTCVDGSKFAPSTRPVIGKINQQVIKESGKPFLSGNTINTIKGYIPHPYLINEQAYNFYEDDSYVETRRCIIVEGGTKMFNIDVDKLTIEECKEMFEKVEELQSKLIEKITSSNTDFEEKFSNWVLYGVKEDLPWISSAGELVRNYLVESNVDRYKTKDLDTLLDWIYEDEDYCISVYDDDNDTSTLTFTEAGIELLTAIMEANLGSITMDW